jgi:hypothetical protein
MPSKTPQFSSELHDMVFAKTPKGRAEVAQRSALLSRKQRSILIVLDGKKRLSAIHTLLPSQELAAIVHQLLALELIAAQIEVAVSAAAPKTAAAGHPLTPAPAQPADPARLLRLKAMLIDSAETHLGLMAAEVVRRVELACDETQLRSVLGHWHMAMRESKYGKDVAGMHLEQIKASWRGEDMMAPLSPPR